MTYILITQLVLSFIVGALVITFLSFLAERTNENISGIIMMFPSTMVIGFFFLGLTTSAQKVASIIPATIVPMGIVILSSVIYIYCSSIFSSFLKSKIWQIGASFILSSVIWFVLAAPFAIWKFSNLPLGILIFFILIFFSHLILKKHISKDNAIKHIYTKPQILFRAFFIGGTVALVVFLGKIVDPFWAGIVTLYPAGTFTTLVIFDYYYPSEHLFHIMKHLPVGSLTLFVYAISTMFLFPEYGIEYGTLLSYAICLLFTFFLIKLNLITNGKKGIQ